MTNYTAVLIDTTSIQQYVFSGNKLKENLGASFLVQNIYEELLNDCSNKPDKIGFIGGGNALLFFNERERATEFVKEWTGNLLIETPGLTTAVAISNESEGINENDLNDKTKFKEFKKKLFYQLIENKNSINRQVIISSHGITADCRNTGLSMEDWFDDNAEKKDSGYFSSVSSSKQNSVFDSYDLLNLEFPKVRHSKLKFANNLEELGSSKNQDSHIAIVHIDGNGMGKRFEACITLEEIKELSIGLEEATKKSFAQLLEHIISNKEKIAKEIDIDKDIIPIRPIILGGDDITFVCDGRLGIYFAQKFMEYFETQEVSDKQKLTACAGVAITKLKYPFYRGYKLSEELCKNAKSIRKKRIDKNPKEDGSYIDFHIAYGGISDEINNIREKEYKVQQGDLLMRPYNITSKESTYSFEKFIDVTIKVLDKLPNSKLKDLREVLYLGEESTKSIRIELQKRSKELLLTNGDNLFDDELTPYFDIVEISEIYPKFIIKPGGKK